MQSTETIRINGEGRQFSNKIALITASTSGIGLAIAEKLGKDGATVLVSSRREENVKKATEDLRKDGIKAIGTVCHVANAEQRKDLFEKIKELGGLDILVCNAAVNPSVNLILDTDEREWEKIFEVNVKATFLLIKEAIPYLKKRSDGRIVIISSAAAYHPNGEIGAYSVSKTALLGLTKAIAHQMGPYNITVNCVAPGLIATKFGSALIDNRRLNAACLKYTIFKRHGTANEVSAVVKFLCSHEASYITGETIMVAGGGGPRL